MSLTRSPLIGSPGSHRSDAITADWFTSSSATACGYQEMMNCIPSSQYLFALRAHKVRVLVYIAGAAVVGELPNVSIVEIQNIPIHQPLLQ